MNAVSRVMGPSGMPSRSRFFEMMQLERADLDLTALVSLFDEATSSKSSIPRPNTFKVPHDVLV